MAKSKIRVPFPTALRMVASYAGSRVRDQVRAVAFIVLYMVGYQLLVFRSPPGDAVTLGLGIGIVVMGLTFFLEGLLLGLMPLSERVGIQLPLRGGGLMIALFGLLLGITATLAEPAVVSLRTASGGIPAWESPLLYYLLELNSGALVMAIATGVGLAVTIGLLRFHLGFRIKPVILTVIPVLTIFSLMLSRFPTLSPILGLAWDSGAITTGPVTVPLTLALGVGLSRARHHRGGGPGDSFGIVTLAVTLSALAVMVLGVISASGLPAPTDEARFFSREYREKALGLFGSEKALFEYAMAHGSDSTRNAVMEETGDAYALLDEAAVPSREISGVKDRILAELLREVKPSIQAVMPVTLFMTAALFLLLRDRPRYVDELLLGIAFTLVGMILLGAGISTGLAPLGADSGRRLSLSITEDGNDTVTVAIPDFDTSMLIPAVGPDGEERSYFLLDGGHSPTIEPFVPDRLNPEDGTYLHQNVLPRSKWSASGGVGLFLVLLFAFGTGFGTALAEPSLKALGHTVEEITVGTVKSTGMIRAVALGVGIGVTAGILRIIFEIPMIWMLLPPYLLLIPLTLLSDDLFVGMAWDSGGVTTGPVTVPLVLNLGLGLGSAVGVSDGFGILAMASAYPVICTLFFGIMVHRRQRRIMISAAETED